MADVGGVENIVAAMRAHQHQEHVQCAGCLALVRAALDALARARPCCRQLKPAQALIALWVLAYQGRAVQVEAQGLACKVP